MCPNKHYYAQAAVGAVGVEHARCDRAGQGAPRPRAQGALDAFVTLFFLLTEEPAAEVCRLPCEF